MDGFLSDHGILLEFVKEALGTCLSNHQFKCSPHRIDPLAFLPTRLLDLEDIRRPKLVVTSGKEIQDRRYVPLSHQWGAPDLIEKRAMMTTMESLGSRMSGFDLSSLPTRYQVVATLCAAIGIRYIWIDSLCIVQDSSHDWELEWPTMSRVYEGGVLTIGSNLPSNDNHFIPPEPLEWARQLWESGPNKAWLSRLIGDGPLSQRAWCLQERQLSSRILHIFLGPTWVWECNTRVRGCNSSGLVYAKDFTDASPWRKSDFSGNTLQASSREALLALWDKVLLDYTKREMTFESDKLPAISAVVQKLHAPLGLEYLAGIWETDIYGLMWHCGCSFILELKSWTSEHEDFGPAVSPSRAPSYSWASVNGFTYNFTSKTSTERCVIDRISNQSEKSEGFVARGEALILAKAVAHPTISNLFLQISHGSPPVIITGHHSKNPYFDQNRAGGFINGSAQIFFDKRPLNIELFPIDDEEVARASGDFKYLHSCLEKGHLCLLCLGAAFGRQLPTMKVSVFGLILLPSTANGTFSRVGIFRSTSNMVGELQDIDRLGREIWMERIMQEQFGRKADFIVV